jgi:5-aminolevulinate synthase
VLASKGIPVLPNKSHIIPVLIGDPIKCKKASDMLLNDYHIYIQPINYPTVPRGQELLRISPTPNHSEKLINQLADSLNEVFDRLEIKRLNDLKDDPLFKKD